MAQLLTETDRIFALDKDEFDMQQLDALQAMKAIRLFIQRRKTVMEELDRDWQIEVESQPGLPMYEVVLGNAQGTFSTQWNETAHDAAEAELSLDGSLVESRTVMSVRANKNRLAFADDRIRILLPRLFWSMKGLTIPT